MPLPGGSVQEAWAESRPGVAGWRDAGRSGRRSCWFLPGCASPPRARILRRTGSGLRAQGLEEGPILGGQRRRRRAASAHNPSAAEAGGAGTKWKLKELVASS